jgi:uncharacterized small protein (DUF1192 family)
MFAVGMLQLGRSIMDVDEVRILPKTIAVGDNLESLGLNELAARVLSLEEEILRIKAEIAKKQASKQAADAFFKL